jgi:ABC-2 type transport system ATP-binding protein
MTAIRCQGLTRRYGELLALDRLDLAVQPGAIYGFLGPNGAGKTTTLRLLTGLATPSAGQVWIDGVAVAEDPVEARRRLGYLPEQPAFYPWMTAAETLGLCGQLHGLSRPAARHRAGELLDLAGLGGGVARRRVGGFSRGMRQRLGLAVALVHRPAILLLDEPVSALDPAGRREVLQLLERLQGQVTVFMSTHILADVERVCDTVGILDRGRLVVEAPREELERQYAVPVLEVEHLAEPVAAAAPVAELRGQPWARQVEEEGNVLRVHAGADLAATRDALLTWAASSGLPVVRFEVIRPSLEDLFLRLVGQGEDA